ncbi:MAG: MFS transporter [Armatimonadota bacterium]|nr:MFS transporter [Armatimonadota bacterium]
MQHDRTRRAGTTRAFEAPGFRWLWLSALFSAVAWTVETLTNGWLALEMTNSPFWVGIVAGVRGVGLFAFSVPGGVLGDRMDRRRLLLLSQILPALGLLVLAPLVLWGAVRLGHVIAFSLLTGVTSALEKPASSGLTYDLVGQARLLNASVFRFMAGSAVRVIGAVAGGYIIDRFGIGQNYVLAAAAHVAGAACVLALQTQATPSRVAEPFLAAVTSGVRYVARTPQVRQFLWLSLMTEGFGFSYSSMLPVVARDVLQVGGLGLGYLSAAGGLGQLAATLGLASQGDLAHKDRFTVTTAIGFGLAVALFGLSPWYPASLALVGAVGALGSLYDAGMATVLLLAASDQMRARVQGFYSATIGFNQVTGFGVGLLATLLGAPVALAISGCVAAGSALALLPRVRRSSS